MIRLPRIPKGSLATAARLLFLAAAGGTITAWLILVFNEAYAIRGSRPYFSYLELADSVFPIVAVVMGGTAIFLGTRHRFKEDARRRDTIVDQSLTSVQIITQVLEDRISQLTRSSTAIYWTILVILLGGLVLVVFSGYLSSFDSVSSNLFTRIDSQETRTRSDFADSVIIGGTQTPEMQKAIADSLQQRTRLLADIAEQRKTVLHAVLDGLKSREQTGTGLNLSGTVLRICIIGLIIFLVQILVQLYRYNSRLISFYSSRRDALLLSEGDPKKLEALTRLFAPVGLDFGRSPSHPLQEMATLLVPTSKSGGTTRAKGHEASPA